MFWHWHGVGPWPIGYLTAGVVILVGLAVVVALVLSRPGRGPAGPTPKQILAERFARGEIDEEEYRDRLRVLTG